MLCQNKLRERILKRRRGSKAKHLFDKLKFQLLSYLGKPGWLFMLVVFKFSSLKFKYIDCGLSFELLTWATEALSHISLMITLFVTLTSEMGVWEWVQRQKRKETKLEVIITKNFSQINVRHQTTIPGSSENVKKDKCKNSNKQAASRRVIFNLQKLRERRLERSQRSIGNGSHL